VADGTGLMSEPHEDADIAAKRFADTVSALYERDLDAMGAAARQHVEAHYSWTRALQGLMTRYQAAVSSRQRVSVAGSLEGARSIQ
jgi:hypothetical protein